MATVFMKWLETKPEDYERGIQLLTLGQLGLLHTRLADLLVHEGMRVLEIGCGTGALTMAMVRGGAHVTAIDLSKEMLAEAEMRFKAAGLENNIDLLLMDASEIDLRFKSASFDLIVSSLAFSEMTSQAQAYVLHACGGLLSPEGKLAIIDETRPEGFLGRIAASVVRAPLRAITWLLTRTTTHPLRDFQSMLLRAGFRTNAVESRLGGNLKLFVADPLERAIAGELPATIRGQLTHRTTWRTLLTDLWAIFLRILPPYPRFVPGLYVVGQPTEDSPVLVTGNFDLTVRRLVRAIEDLQGAWVLIVNTAGINVWCAAGGGFFTAERIIGALRISGLEAFVRHRVLTLPQLCANGVDGGRIRSATGWDVRWGPVRAADIPAYIHAGGEKTDGMRAVEFPLRDRLEMMAATLGFYGLVILLPLAVFWRDLFMPVLLSLLGLSIFYAIVHPWLPGRDGLQKSVPLAVLALGGLIAYTLLWDPVPAMSLFRRSLGLVALSVFTAAELQGMSPMMRGEQANWGLEAVIGVILGAIYWLIPFVAGWR
jgi:ubiquinone/menaquinone biosynthesis C-methylase UbiE